MGTYLKVPGAEGATSGCLSHGGMYACGTGVFPDTNLVVGMVQFPSHPANT